CRPRLLPRNVLDKPLGFRVEVDDKPLFHLKEWVIRDHHVNEGARCLPYTKIPVEVDCFYRKACPAALNPAPPAGTPKTGSPEPSRQLVVAFQRIPKSHREMNAQIAREARAVEFKFNVAPVLGR